MARRPTTDTARIATLARKAERAARIADGTAGRYRSGAGAHQGKTRAEANRRACRKGAWS